MNFFVVSGAACVALEIHENSAEFPFASPLPAEPSVMKSMSFLLWLLALTSLFPAHAQNPNAIAQLERAVHFCDRGLTIEQPDTPLGQRVLQRYWRKYQLHRNAAEAMAPEILSGKHRFASKTQGKKTFAELDRHCRDALPNRLKTLAPQPVPPLNARARAMAHASRAIRGFCAAYARPPYSAGPVNHRRLERDWAAYRQDRRQAERFFPAIGKTKLTAPWPSKATAPSREMTQTMAQWFARCDKAFPAYQQAIANRPAAVTSPPPAVPAKAILPPTAPTESEEMEAPPASEEETSEETITEPASDETAEEEMPPETSEEEEAPVDEEGEGMTEAEEEALYNEVTAKSSGDRADLLDSEGRLPDFADDEEKIHKAKLWQFEYEDESGTIFCVEFKFAGNTIDAEEEFDGECPGF